MSDKKDHYYARVIKFDNSFAIANTIEGSSNMESITIHFAPDTKGYDRIEKGDVPKYIKVFTDDHGVAFDFVEIDSSTPPMIHHDTETWLKTNIAKCIYADCTIPTAAHRLGISKETAGKYYMKVMSECSIRAVHHLYGKIRIFSDKNKYWFILHPDLDRGCRS